jgi:D-threo-aldose 1-dehydrogenase
MGFDPSAKGRLGQSLVEVSRLALGGGPLSGPLGAATPDDVDALVARAWEHGIRFFDTAPLYGTGESERRLGRALSRWKPEEYVVATKVGRLLRPGTSGAAEPTFDFSYDGVMRSLDESLMRLRMTSVHVLHIHDPDDHWDQASEGAYLALDTLRSSGVVKAIGAGMNQASMLERFANEVHLDAFLLAGRYTLLDHTTSHSLMSTCAKKGIGIIIGGVYNSGILAGPIEGARYNYAPASSAWLERAQRLDAVCARHGVPLKAAALQFPLANPAVNTILTGVRSIEELEENVAMARVEIPDALWQDLRRERLVEDWVPLPDGA